MRYAFGEYLLDTACYELYHTGTFVPLRPKVLEVLAYLVVHHDRVVPKQELLAQLWPDQVVGEDGLKAYIMAVRQALGDRGPAPRLLRTVRGRGYRFVAPLTLLDAVPASPPTPGRLPGPVQDQAEPAPAPVVPHPSAQPALTAERKLATVLVCALSEATTPAKPLEPEALHHRRQALLAQAVEVMQQYGGTLQRVLDDGCVALFGAPVAHEDHALRAVLTATTLHQRLRLSSAAELQESQELAVRIGLHTGQVVMGPVGDQQMLTVTAVGDTLQLAVQLQQLATPGTTLLSETTRQRVRDTVQVAAWHPPSGSATLPGPVAYHVCTVLPERPPLEARMGRVLSRFVGRQHDLAILQTLWAQVERGRGQVVGVVGHPGVGKSRLLYEFRQRFGTPLVTYWYGRCVSYGSATPYLPLLGLLRHACQITEADPPEAIAAKVHQQLQAIGLTPAEAAPYVLSLLGVAMPPNPLTTQSPQVVRARTVETLVQMCLHGSRQRPLLLEVEDLHWVDASSHECLAALVERLAGVPILLLVTARPGYRPPWIDKSYATQMVLQPLSPQESLTVFQGALGTTALPQALVHTVVSKAEGNPFFLEEFARAVVEHEGQLSTLAVPETVQAVLAARIDRLPPEAKRLLQLAAVMGREVVLPLLQAAAGLPAEALHLHLGQLQAAEFLYETRLVPAVAYTFQHALTQEVAYASLVQRTRQQMHGQIARVLEAQLPAIVQAQPELLAHHYTEAGLAEPAVEYWQRAGKRARYAGEREAVAHVSKGLEVLQTQDTPHLFLVLTQLRTVHTARAEHQTARALAAQALTLVQRLQDPALLVVAHYSFGTTLLHLGDLTSARGHFEQAIARYDAQRGGPQVGFTVQALGYVAQTLWMLGHPDQALQRHHEALTVLQRWSLPGTVHEALYNASGLHQLCREVHAVYERTEAAMPLASEYGSAPMLALLQHQQGWVLAAQGRYKEGMAQMRQGLAVLRTMGEEVGRPRLLALLAEAYGKSGQAEEGLRLLAEALALVDNTGERQDEAEVHRLKGELLLWQTVPDAPQAEACFHQALAVARRQQAKSWELRAAMSLSRLWQQQGKHAEARQLLADVYGWFTEGFDTADLQEAKALLAELRT